MMLLQLVNWLSEVTGDATALGFTCKGTEAQALRECKTATDAGRHDGALPCCLQMIAQWWQDGMYDTQPVNQCMW